MTLDPDSPHYSAPTTTEVVEVHRHRDLVALVLELLRTASAVTAAIALIVIAAALS